MICTSCGTENEAGRKFCLSCGARLAVTCAQCGTANTPEAKFCGECGAPLADAARAASGGPTTGSMTERRLVSVLFADLVGFTTLAEARDAEDVRALLDTYFELSRAVVDRYGGTVEKFIGDAVMAVWGTPTAQEDDAERAVRAALDLVDAVRRLGAEHDMPDLALRAGVHTGEAVVTIGATGMGMVTGDLVNTASRLQSVAAPGTVLVGEGTRRAAGTAIVFEEAGEQELKGKATPVAAFRALRVVAQRGGVGRSEGLEPPFVGRDTELQLIKDFYHATARDAGPRLVSVIGQAGIGKSRLAWEFLKYIDGVTEVVYWHQGRSPAYGDGISFWALGEMVRMRIGADEAADEATVRRLLGESLDEFVTDPDERRTLEPALLQLLGQGDGSAGDRSARFLAWRTFFERIAEVAPVAMVFEDLQWADDGLLDFIEELVTWSRGRSIYLITLARPELLDRRPTWGAGQRSFTSLGLAPLPDDTMRALLDGLVPGLPAAVLDGIVERAEGIPLYAVETVRTLLNEGRIERDGERFRPVGDLTSLAVPESLHALIAARIDALPAAERTLVQDAAVLGASFGLPALRAVARAAPDEIDSMLAHLVQRELLTIDDDPRSPERGNYRFVQGLLREVAYGTLSRDDRRARHLAAARHYEALGEDELSGVLAQHYVDAYQAHPDGPEGAAVAAQARVALRAAAQRAADLGSHRLAGRYLDRALEVTTDDREALDLHSEATRAYAHAGALDTAVAHAERALELATTLEMDRERRLAAGWLANILIEGHQGRAHDLLTSVMSEPGMGPGAPGYLEVASLLAKVEMRMLNDARAVEIADEVLRHVTGPGHEQLVLDTLITRATALANMDHMTEAVTILTGALDEATRLGLEGEANRAGVNLGYAFGPDDPRRTFEVSQALVERAMRKGVMWEIRYLVGNAIDAAIEVGEWEWALEQLDQVEDVDPAGTEAIEEVWFGSYRAIVGAYRGEDVATLAEHLVELSQDVDDPQFRWIGAWGAVILSMLQGNVARAVELATPLASMGIAGADAGVHAARAAIWSGDVEIARSMLPAIRRMPSGRRSTMLARSMEAGVAMLEGRRTDARPMYAEARRLGRELGLRIWLGLTDLDIVITGAMDADERREAAREAREIFTDLRAQALLDRLDAAESAAPPPPARPQSVSAEVAEEV